MKEMGTISKAGLGLLKFVKAVLGYCSVYKIVKPKQLKVAALEKEFNVVRNLIISILRNILLLSHILHIF
jgi:dynein heavy chain